jgi:branched-chain amino acid transport system ATP-binding protein
VTLHFGGVRALEDVSFHVAQGNIHALIGPNGAGKTSLLNCISGLYRPQAGRITLHRGEGPRASSPGRNPAGSPASGWLAPSRTSSCSST